VHIELQKNKVRQQNDYDESSQDNCDYPRPVSGPEFLACLVRPLPVLYARILIALTSQNAG